MQRVTTSRQELLCWSGRVRTGAGHGAGFTALDWARRQFIDHCGIDPHPGTLNIAVETRADRDAWASLRDRQGARVRPPAELDACDAVLYPVTLTGGHESTALPAAVVVPDVPDYATEQVEIIAAVNLREHFDLVDGRVVDVEALEPHGLGSVMFDVDGTLLNSLDGYRLAASRAMEPYGYTVSIDHVRRALDTAQPFWDFVIPDGEPRDERRIAEIRDATMRHWPDALREVVTVLPGVADALERLRSAGIRIAVYTGSTGESFPVLRDAGLLELFEVVVTGADVERRKPDPHGIDICLERLGVAPEDAAYVGDSCIDVTASRAAGVTAIAVLTGAGSSASLSVAGARRVAAGVGGVPELIEIG